MIFLSAAFVSASATDAELREGTLMYYKSDTAGSYPDAVGFSNGTLKNSPTFTANGKIGGAYEFDASNKDYVNTNHKYSSADNITLSMWMKIPSSANGQIMASNFDLDSNRDGFILQEGTSDGSVNWVVYTGSGSDSNVVTSQGGLIDDGDWHHVVAWGNDTCIELYVDANSIGTDCTFDPKYSNTKFNLTVAYFEESGTSPSFDGTIDEVAVWNRSLSEAEISELYDRQLNNESGAQYPFSSLKFVSPSPADGATNNTISGVVWNITESDSINVTWNGTQVGNGSESQPFSFELNNTLVPTDGTYTINASDGTITLSRQWTYDSTEPPITINDNNFFGSDNISQNSQFSSTAQANITINDNESLFGFQLNISRFGVTEFNYTNESLSGTSFTFDDSINISNFEEGLYNVTVLASDSHTATRIPDYDVEKGSDFLRFDTVEGNRIELETPNARSVEAQKKKDRYRFITEYASSGRRSFILKSDKPIRYLPNSQWPAHFVVWNSQTKSGNWIDFDGASNDYTVQKLSTKSQFLFFGEKTYRYRITFNNLPDHVIFNSIGGLNVNTQTYQWYKGEVTSEESENLTQLTATITANYTVGGNISDIDADLSYNGTSYSSPTKTSSTGSITFEQEVTIPTVSSNENLTYYWNATVTHTDSSSTEENNSFQHEIFLWDLDDCSAYATPAANYTFRKESDNSVITSGDASGEYNFSPGESVSKTFTLDKDNVNGFDICITPAFAELEATYSLNYEATDFPVRQFSEDGGDFSKEPRNISLFLLNSTAALFPQFKVQDTLENALEGVLGEASLKISGEDQVVESTFSDSSGSMTMVLDPNKEYGFTFSKSGFDTTTFSLRPTQGEVYTVTMGEGLTQEQIAKEVIGVSYSFLPSVAPLENNTNYTFAFNLTSQDFDIDSCSLELRDENQTILTDKTGSPNATNCDIGIGYNTGNLTQISAFGNYNLNESNAMTVSRTWSVYHSFQGDFSLQTFLDDLNAFTEAGFNDRTKLLIAFIIIALVVGSTTIFGGVINVEGQLLLVWILVGFFSYINWLNFNFTNFPDAFAPFLNQWWIFIMTSLVVLATLAERNL